MNPDPATPEATTCHYEALARSVHSALETYSNVHRGSGHFSEISTRLFEQAREVVLQYLELDRKKFTVIFGTPVWEAFRHSLRLSVAPRQDIVMEEEQALTAHALCGLAGIRGLTVFGISDPMASGFSSRAGVIAFSLKGMMADKLVRVLTEIAERRKPAGTSKKTKPRQMMQRYTKEILNKIYN